MQNLQRLVSHTRSFVSGEFALKNGGRNHSNIILVSQILCYFPEISEKMKFFLRNVVCFVSFETVDHHNYFNRNHFRLIYGTKKILGDFVSYSRILQSCLFRMFKKNFISHDYKVIHSNRQKPSFSYHKSPDMLGFVSL